MPTHSGLNDLLDNPLRSAFRERAQLGFPRTIPYQPIGGIKWVRDGVGNRNIGAPLGLSNALRTDYESFFLRQTLMLLAMGLPRVGLTGFALWALALTVWHLG